MQPDRPKTTGRRVPSCARNPSARLAGLANPGPTAAGGDAQQLQQPTSLDLEDSSNLGEVRDPNRDSGFNRTTDPDCSVATLQRTVGNAPGPSGGGGSQRALLTDESGDEESASDESIYEAIVEEPSSDEEMASRSNRKFERPPSFSGLTTEDVIDWADKYDKIGDYNVWSCKEKHDHVFMYLKGSAEKWFKALTPSTTTWLDVTVNTAGVNVITEGVRTRLLKSFSIGNYKQYHANKLQNCQQLKDENGVEYYYDVIALCKVVDPEMSENEKVNHLMRGLGAELTKVAYPKSRDIKTAEEFLTLIRLEEEAMSLFKKKGGLSHHIAGITNESPSKWDRADQNEKRNSKLGWKQSAKTGNKTLTQRTYADTRKPDPELDELHRQRRALDEKIKQRGDASHVNLRGGASKGVF